MFFQAARIRESRYLEPIRYSPKGQRQKTPEQKYKQQVFVSSQFPTRNVDKRKLSNQERRPRSSLVHKVKSNSLFYTFYCETGNNGQLVKRIMQTRGWFMEQQTTFNVHFIWKQSSSGFNYTTLMGQKKACINHLENHQEISNKFKLFENFKYYCQKMKMQMDDYVPVTFIINLDSSTLSNDLKKFVDYFVSIKKEGNQKNVWLLKPPDLNRGRGIQLFNDLRVFISQVEDFCKAKALSSKKQPIQKNSKSVTICYPDSLDKSGLQTINFVIEPSTGNDRIIVLQKYLELPLLYNNRKFDFRFWVLIDHNQKYYLFREGYLRLSTETFDVNNLKNHYIHLTNNAIQKNHPSYGKFELGNQLSLSDLQQYLQVQRNSKCSTPQILNKIKDLIHHTINCSNGKMRDKKDYQFEIFGYDFMVDKQGQVWLIEINTNPCIEESSPLLQKLIPRMLNDAFRLTIDKIFPPIRAQENLSEFSIPGYNDKDILWEQLGQIQNH